MAIFSRSSTEGRLLTPSKVGDRPDGTKFPALNAHRSSSVSSPKESINLIWKKWTAGFEHTHDALDDAREQARAFHKIMETNIHTKMEPVTKDFATTSGNTAATNSTS